MENQRNEHNVEKSTFV